MYLDPAPFFNPITKLYEVQNLYGDVVISFETLEEAKEFILENM